MADKRKPNKRRSSRRKYATRNIFPDILNLLRVCLILLLVYMGICMLYNGLVPFIGGYSVYTCDEDYDDLGYSKGELLILKNDTEEDKEVVLVRDRGTDFRLEKNSSEDSVGTVVGSFSIVESSKSIYKSILSILKHE